MISSRALLNNLFNTNKTTDVRLMLNAQVTSLLSQVTSLLAQVTSLLSSSSLIYAVSWEITDIDSVSSVIGFDVRLESNPI